MSIRILTGVAEEGTEEISCFFDSAKGVAFGPIMGDRQKAEAFCVWMHKEQGRPDLRRMLGPDLCTYWYPKFEITYADRLCAKCGMYDTETMESLCDSCRE